MFHRGFIVPLGSLDLSNMVLNATWIFSFTITDDLSPNVILSLSRVIRVGELCLRFWAVPLYSLTRGWLSDSISELLGVLYCMSIWDSESNSRFQMADPLSIAFFSFFFSKQKFLSFYSLDYLIVTLLGCFLA